MLCVTSLCLRVITNTIFVILHLTVSHLNMSCSCYVLVFLSAVVDAVALFGMNFMQM